MNYWKSYCKENGMSAQQTKIILERCKKNGSFANIDAYIKREKIITAEELEFDQVLKNFARGRE